MKNFDDIKSIWSENEPNPYIAPRSLSKRKNDQLSFLKKQFMLSAVGLTGFTLFVVWFAFLSNRNFIFELSYTALSLMAGCSFSMVLINLHNVFLISKIDETLAPKEYLNRWVVFYTKRLQFYRLYSPVLFLALCFSFALYVPEILGYYPTTFYKIGFIAFIILIFLGYSVLGKKSILEEKKKLMELNNTIRMLYEE